MKAVVRVPSGCAFRRVLKIPFRVKASTHSSALRLQRKPQTLSVRRRRLLIHPSNVTKGCCGTNLALWDVSTIHPRVLFKRDAHYPRPERLLRYGEGGFEEGTDSGDELGRAVAIQRSALALKISDCGGSLHERLRL